MSEKQKLISERDFEKWRDANPMPTPNVAELRKVVAHVEANMPEWNQDEWGDFHLMDEIPTCETPRCIAGWATTFADTVVVYDKYEWRDAEVDVESTGKMALGLTDVEADALFDSGMYLHDPDGELRRLRQVVRLIAQRAGDQL